MNLQDTANLSGNEIIDAVVNKRLIPLEIRAYDSMIIRELRLLNRHEIANLVHFGDVPRWARDRKAYTEGDPSQKEIK